MCLSFIQTQCQVEKPASGWLSPLLPSGVRITSVGQARGPLLPGHEDGKTRTLLLWGRQVSQLCVPVSCVITPAGAKDTPTETGGAERKGEPKRELGRGGERKGRAKRKERDSRGGDIDSQRSQRPSWNVHMGLESSSNKQVPSLGPSNTPGSNHLPQ